MNEPGLVRCSVSNGVALVTMGHADKPTTMAAAMQEALLGELSSLRDDRSVRAIVLTSAGAAFSVGADLSAMQKLGEGVSRGERTATLMARLTNPIVLALRALPQPVVCAVNGPAAGAGVGLALAADIVLMARSAYFYLPFIPRLGILPDMGTTWFLPRRVGRARAVAMALLGNRISAEQAVQTGLAWAVSDDEQLRGDALALALRLAAVPPGAALEVRAAFDTSEANDLAQQLEYERLRQRELLDGDAFAEGVRAFLEKRQPEFHGAASSQLKETL